MINNVPDVRLTFEPEPSGRCLCVLRLPLVRTQEKLTAGYRSARYV